MSLRSYLFALIGSLIIVLTASQLALLNWIDSYLAQEVETKARHLSQQVIELAFEQIEVESAENSKKSIEQQGSKDSSNKGINKMTRIITRIDSPSGSRILEGDHKIIIAASEIDKQTIKDVERYVDKEFIKHEFETLVADIHEKHLKIITNSGGEQNNFAFVINDSTKNNLHQITQDVSIIKMPSKTESLIQAVQWLLIGSAIIALIFAYWLSAQFNKPLKQLANGFKHLSDGDYQHQVCESGVKEIRTTITHFNDMVIRLASLTIAEKQHKEIAHLAELGEVSRGLAHALRNPIHTIGLTLEQLSQNNLTTEQRAVLLETAQTKICNIDKNIKALLTLTTSGICRDEQVPLLAVIQDIILEMRSSDLVNNHKKITVELNVSAKLIIVGAESEIRSILHTLLINASEASIGNAVIKVSAALIKNNINIQISDTGTGLTPNIAKQLFQPHVSSKAEGAGMGLYIAKRIITLHYQGDLSLVNNSDLSNNNSGEGCTATATFYHLPQEVF